MTLVDDQLEGLADLTLIDENTKLILIDDADKEIPSNMTMHLVAKFLNNACGATWWPNFFLMHVTPYGGQILY